MDVKLTVEGAEKYKTAINRYKFSDDQLIDLEFTGRAYKLTHALLAEILGSPPWYPEKISRFLRRKIYLRDHEAEHFCKTLKIDFNLSEYEIKPGTAPPAVMCDPGFFQEQPANGALLPEGGALLSAVADGSL